MQLDHIQLAIPPGGEERAIAFFAGPLAMKVVEKPEPLRSRGGCWFILGKAHLHLGVEQAFKPQRKAHPAFCVPDLDTLASRLGDAGHDVLWDHALPDRKRFYTNDPFGNRIEFIQQGDGFLQR